MIGVMYGTMLRNGGKVEPNREEWLLNATNKLKPLFEAIDYPLPGQVRVSCGWPSNRSQSSKNKVVGECWQREAAQDRVPQIFISPALYDSVEVLGVLVHELIHAMGIRGHKTDFKKVAILIGLEGKMTSTYPGERLKGKLIKITQDIGDYPHAKLEGRTKPKQSTRLLKAWCAECGYTVRVTRKWLEIAPPTCTTCDTEMESEW